MKGEEGKLIQTGWSGKTSLKTKNSLILSHYVSSEKHITNSM